MDNQVRIDKWLWAVRIFKTRSLAADACRKGKVLLNNGLAKSSKLIKVADKISVRKTLITYTFRVKNLSQKRISAKLAPDFVENLTPEKELKKAVRSQFPDFGSREKGMGRPTKKERRTMDRFHNDVP
jgi:ribosome-associated heat shock protein Hsp15